LAYANRVALVFLPGKSTHVLQPLDLVVFGEIKQLYHKLIYARAVDGELHIEMADFFRVYAETRRRVLTSRFCRSAFRKAGVVPINRSIPHNHDSMQQLHTEQPSVPSQDPPQPEEPAEETPADMIKRAMVLAREQKLRDHHSLLRQIRSRWEADAARTKAQEIEIKRLFTENSALRRASRGRRRHLPSPNSRVMTRRRAAHARGIIVSSPPPDAEGLPESPPHPASPEEINVEDCYGTDSGASSKVRIEVD